MAIISTEHPTFFYSSLIIHSHNKPMAVFMLETLKLPKTLKPPRDDFKV